MGQKTSKFDGAEAWLKPHGQHRWTDVDLRKCEKLVRAGRLAPCYRPYEGDDWADKELEECPICFMAYPSLNWSKCCSKEICTECFLQVKWPNGNRNSVPCPFCKCDFSVIFRGPRSAAERLAARDEEQRVLSATQRARQNSERSSNCKQSSGKACLKFSESEADQPACLLERAATDPAAESNRVATAHAARRRRRRTSSNEETMRAILLSLQLSDPQNAATRAPETPEQEDEMLQQAIRASLADHAAPMIELSTPRSSVQPQAVALSPYPSRSLSVPQPAVPSSSLLRMSSITRPELSELVEQVSSTGRPARHLNFSQKEEVAENCAELRSRLQPACDSDSMALMPVETHGHPETPRSCPKMMPVAGSILNMPDSLLHSHKVSWEAMEGDICQTLQTTSRHGIDLRRETGDMAASKSGVAEVFQEQNDATCSSYGWHPEGSLALLHQRTGAEEESTASSSVPNHWQQFKDLGSNLEAGPLGQSLQMDWFRAGPEEMHHEMAPPDFKLSLQTEPEADTLTLQPSPETSLPAHVSSPFLEEARHGVRDHRNYGDHSSDCSPQYVYSSESPSASASQSASMPDTPVSLANRHLEQNLIPAVWGSTCSAQESQSRAERLPRYLPQLNTQQESSGSPFPSEPSPDDAAWMEFKRSILGTDWLHKADSLPEEQSASWHRVDHKSHPQGEDIEEGLRDRTASEEFLSDCELSELDASGWASLAKQAPARSQSASQHVSAAGIKQSQSIFCQPMDHSMKENDPQSCQVDYSQSKSIQNGLIAAHYSPQIPRKREHRRKWDEGLDVQKSPARLREAKASDLQSSGRKSVSFAELVQGSKPGEAGTHFLQKSRETDWRNNMETEPLHRLYAQQVEQKKHPKQPCALLIQNPGTDDMAVGIPVQLTTGTRDNDSDDGREPSYDAPNSAEDEALKLRLQKADADMQRVCSQQPGSKGGNLRGQHNVDDAFLAKLRAMDEEYAARLKRRNEATCASVPSP